MGFTWNTTWCFKRTTAREEKKRCFTSCLPEIFEDCRVKWAFINQLDRRWIPRFWKHDNPIPHLDTHFPYTLYMLIWPPATSCLTVWSRGHLRCLPVLLIFPSFAPFLQISNFWSFLSEFLHDGAFKNTKTPYMPTRSHGIPSSSFPVFPLFFTKKRSINAHTGVWTTLAENSGGYTPFELRCQFTREDKKTYIQGVCTWSVCQFCLKLTFPRPI